MIQLLAKVFFGTIFLLSISSQNVYAQSHAVDNSYFNHLAEVNSQWNNHSDYSPVGLVSFETDKDRIQLHLELVSQTLIENTPSTLTIEQRTNRLTLLDELKEYAENKVFPTNKYHLTRRPYFVDEDGVHCAVGYLIAQSGHTDLVAAIQKDYNYEYIKDIKTPGLLEWAVNYGFGVEELKWIQPTYPPTTVLHTISAGTNGPVNSFYADNYDGRIIFSGDFDEVDGLPCINIGIYDDDQLSCLGSGVEGIVHQVFRNLSGVHAVGALDNGGTVYPVASFDGSNWSYLSIPGRDGAVCTAAHPGGSGYKMEIAISHSSVPNGQEIWYLSDANVWEKKAEVDGIVLDIEPSGIGRIFAGHFSTVQTFVGATLDTTLNVNNILVKDNNTDYWFGFGPEVSDTVKVIKAFGQAIYFGGSASFNWNYATPCLSRYLNNTMQPLLTSWHFSDTISSSINAIEFDFSTGTDFILGGDFIVQPMMGTQGRHLAKFGVATNYFEPMSSLDNSVTSLGYLDGDLVIGGHFTTNYSGGAGLNHLARVDPFAELSEQPTQQESLVFPNPFIDQIEVSGIASGTNYSIINQAGQIVSKGKFNDGKILNLQALPTGIYMLHMDVEGQKRVLKMMKE
ncbi:MAG: T9SS type A sorting domain-containing protein [Crocinitomicaceae bacterium]|nr:T9SS type A sorting domain-containing protein [Crocinitomicaceae bacterium]